MGQTFPMNNGPSPAKAYLSMKRIRRMVEAQFLLPRDGLMGSIPRSASRARQIVFWLIRKHLPEFSFPDIAEYFGLKDHTTVLHGVRKIEKALATGDPMISRIVQQIEDNLSINSKEPQVQPIKVAFCSKLHHADFILGFQREGFHFISRWLYMGNLARTQSKPASHWLEENFEDIKSADYVIVYAERTPEDSLANAGEVLKTALVEAGWAMAFGKQLIVIGDHESYRPWRGASHRVKMIATIEEALGWIKSRHTAKRDLLDSDGKLG